MRFREICEKAGYSYSRVQNWINASADFPAPDTAPHKYRAWKPERYEEVVEWLRAYEAKLNPVNVANGFKRGQR